MEYSARGKVSLREIAACAEKMHFKDMRLAKFRELRGLSQADLGEMVGLSSPTIQRAETMHRTAMLRTYILCADALGVPLADLFSDGESSIEREIISAVRRLPEHRVRALLEFLSALENQAPNKED